MTLTVLFNSLHYLLLLLLADVFHFSQHFKICVLIFAVDTCRHCFIQHVNKRWNPKLCPKESNDLLLFASKDRHPLLL